MRHLCTLLVAVGLAGCDRAGAIAPDAAEPDLAARIAALPGVRVVEQTWSHDPPAEPGRRHFDLWFTLPIDHDHPELGTFELYAALVHRAVAAPLVVYTSGYAAGWIRHLAEPARLLDANQLSLEHRFYGPVIAAARGWVAALEPGWNLARRSAMMIA